LITNLHLRSLACNELEKGIVTILGTHVQVLDPSREDVEMKAFMSGV
jgi:hypothetical protein